MGNLHKVYQTYYKTHILYKYRTSNVEIKNSNEQNFCKDLMYYFEVVNEEGIFSKSTPFVASKSKTLRRNYPNLR